MQLTLDYWSPWPTSPNLLLMASLQDTLHLNVHPRLTDHGQNQLSPHTTIKQDQSQHQK